MAKIDKSKYTKGEWKLIREQRRLEKEQNRIRKESERLQKTQTETKELERPERDINYAVNAPRTIVCLKHGTKYSAEYVNILYKMCKRNSTLPFNFVCFTEDAEGIDTSVIRVLPLPEIPNATGWWYKPMFFNPQLPIKGTILYMDLDVVICGNIDKLWTFNPGKFVIIKDFNRAIRRDWKKFNSSIFRMEVGSKPNVYWDFQDEAAKHMRMYHGDQDWIYAKIREDYLFWPKEWIMSYKWEMRDRRHLIRFPNGRRNFTHKEEPKHHPETSIAVFHGEPHPHEVEDDWVKDKWK